MPKLIYFVGTDRESIRSIEKGMARHCHIALHQTGSFIKIFVLSNISLEGLGFEKYSTSLNAGRSAYISTLTLDEVLKKLSESFELDKR